MKLNNHRHIIYLLLLVMFFFFWACSPKFSHKVNTFFFDGIPDPYNVEVKIMIDSTLTADGKTVNEIRVIPVIRNALNLHTPYKEKKCEKCHDRSNMSKPGLPSPELCYQCHEDFNEIYKVVHGPVGSGDCTECHNPHQSRLDNLLTWSEQDICLHCHSMERIFNDKIHKEINNTSCNECHNPHGGDNMNLLKIKK